PKAASNTAGEYDIRVKVRPRSHRAGDTPPHPVGIKIVVVAFFDSEFAIQEPREIKEQVQGEFTFRLRNSGNTPVAYALILQDDKNTEWLSLAENNAREAIVNVAPEATKTITVRAARKQRRLFGKPEPRSFSVTARNTTVGDPKQDKVLTPQSG